MLGKLIKHEFRATAAPMLLLSLGVLAVSGLTRLCMLLAQYFEFFMMLSMITTVMYGIGIAAAYIFVYVLIIRRFYTNIYGAEGYITLTLPTARWKLIFSKLFVAIVWTLLGAITTILSLVIIASYPDVLYEVFTALGSIGAMLADAAYYLNMPEALLISEFVLACVIGAIEGILVLYASVSIGQLFRKHRLLGSVAGYMMIYAATQLIMSGYMMVAGMTLGTFGGQYNYFAPTIDSMTAFQLQVLIILYLAILALITLGCYMITHGIMKKAVNLQ